MSNGSLMVAGAGTFVLGAGGLAVTASTVLPKHKQNVALLRQEEKRLAAHQKRLGTLTAEAREFHAKLMAEFDNAPKMLGPGSGNGQGVRVVPLVKNEAALAAKRINSFNIPTTMNGIEVYGARAAKTGRTLKMFGLASAALMAIGASALLINR